MSQEEEEERDERQEAVKVLSRDRHASRQSCGERRKADAVWMRSQSEDGAQGE